ncbi:MerR family transcriptional regulator [Cohnella pontilimi]|uniref:MerR family transcriptional regulator n=1 Tax=Cohnella pontilimi TaxID=2564100 RepID=A0A4U0F958_9BACL|nr:MerR family transcriptional regulator [Cohnella pontilimi]TJY39602.1 MerR family transcriptional regulator [Cohnella pontilimi]
MNRYKIEDVAKECGLTKRTIRYYEEIGLLFPPERSEGGFRIYTDKHIERLKQIINARDVLGISLQELQEFISISEQFNNQRQEVRQIQDKELKLEKVAGLKQTLSQQLRLIDQKMDKLTAIRAQCSELYDRVLAAEDRIKSEQE